ncbi:MAG: hypothetical protein EBR82_35235 [Caulobacteraceae bacterium]|nr:hypothetical protein [Caulobacteraceae bacterium]
MLGFLMNRWVLGGLAGLVMLGFVYWKGVNHGKEVVQQKWDAYKVVQEREVQLLKDQARKTEQSMQKEINRIQKEKVNANQIATTRYNALINSLRNRPETRQDPVSNDSGSGVGCTGAGLARGDAEFLAGYAADAARLQAAYDSCRDAYEIIKKQANGE